MSSSNRQTIQWPFNNASGHESQSTIPISFSFPLFPSFPRRNTWGFGRPVSSILTLDSIVPDYVINFIRGETPETLARKRTQRQGPLNPEVQRHARRYQSRTAEIYYSGTVSELDQSRSPSAVNDLERMLGEDEKGAKRRQPRKLTAGWRGGVALNVLLVFLILAAAIVCLVLTSLKARKLGGEISIVEGTAENALNVSRGLHVVVNVFAVVLIAGANYVYQILLSPTRAEVDAAHEKLQWLDIGIPSLRNLAYVTVGRVLLSCFLLIVALGSQIL